MRIGALVSQFNEDITEGLLKGVMQVCAEKDMQLLPQNVLPAPGAFELPLLAKKMAQREDIDAVICIGCVIKGETAHFEYISEAATHGILQASLETEKPIAFGVLTVYKRADAEKRAAPGPENKGREAALAIFESLQTIQRINLA